MEEWPAFQVSKLDAARRQLETAITLLFSGGDAVSIHTLAHAAFGIVRDVSISRNKTADVPHVKQFVEALKDADFKKGFNRAGNFFKHAERDPTGFLSGVPEEENESLIWIAVALYRGMGCLVTTEIEAFHLWWCSINFDPIDDVKEPFITWVNTNVQRLHSEDRDDLLLLGSELLALLKRRDSVDSKPGA